MHRTTDALELSPWATDEKIQKSKSTPEGKEAVLKSFGLSEKQINRQTPIYDFFSKSETIFVRRKKIKRGRRFRRSKCFLCMAEYRKSGKRLKKCIHIPGL